MTTDYTPPDRQRAPGAGRPPFFDAPMVELTAIMPSDYWECVVSVGDGNRSEGLRRIVGRWMATRGTIIEKFP